MSGLVSFLSEAASYAWATFTYLVGYALVIVIAPAVSVAAQRSRRGAGRRLSESWAGSLVLGMSTRPTRSALVRNLRSTRHPVAFLVGAHFLTAYPLILLGPLLGKDVLLSHATGTVILTFLVAVSWRGRDGPGHSASAQESESPGRLALREITEIGPQGVLGLALGGLVAAWGLTEWRIELATALGGGIAAQIGSALAGTALGSSTALPPVAALFVATYLWKTGIAHAGLVSFLLASAASWQRRRIYREVLGHESGTRLWWTFLIAGPLAGVATAILWHVLGLTIHYRLAPEQLL